MNLMNALAIIKKAKVHNWLMGATRLSKLSLVFVAFSGMLTRSILVNLRLCETLAAKLATETQAFLSNARSRHFS